MTGLFSSESPRPAAWPVWSDSVRSDSPSAPRFKALRSKKATLALWHRARQFERRTRRPGKQDGRLGRNALLVLHALIFDCLNHVSGRLDPSYATLARYGNLSMRSVARGLEVLKEVGIVTWIRRCSWDDETGQLCQDTNAYFIQGESNWRGYAMPPPPDRDALGCPPPMPDALATIGGGADLHSSIMRAADLAGAGKSAPEPRDNLAAALARLALARRGNAGA
jgi:hypothetical protein